MRKFIFQKCVETSEVRSTSLDRRLLDLPCAQAHCKAAETPCYVCPLLFVCCYFGNRITLCFVVCNHDENVNFNVMVPLLCYIVILSLFLLYIVFTSFLLIYGAFAQS
jgi:hypothetical protein